VRTSPDRTAALLQSVAGAAGFLFKATPPDRLVEGIRTVCARESLLAPHLTRRLIEEYLRRPRPSRTCHTRCAS
jgi:DNA-binding NarL/FixJ family response regulator